MALAALTTAALLALTPILSYALTDTKLRFCSSLWYNPSLVEFGDKYISAAKHTRFRTVSQKTWWINSLYMCEGDKGDLHGLSCKPFNPWKSSFRECELDKRVRGGKIDSAGLGDVKVWRWPGRGVYAIFGRKPQRSRSSRSRYCQDITVYHQWIAQVKVEPGAGEWDLTQGDPLPLTVPRDHTYAPDTPYVMEKNWMPFVYRESADAPERLMVTYSVNPHIVLEVFRNGTTAQVANTTDSKLFEKFTDFDVHGGPPIVYVPKDRAADGKPYYLGIMHHIEKFENGRVRMYRHFAYKVEAQPPFAVTAISDELPLVFNQTFKASTRFVAFVSGLFLTDSGDVVVTYGAADIECRALSMPVKELEAMFTGEAKFRENKDPLGLIDSTAARKELREEDEESGDERTGDEEATEREPESGEAGGANQEAEDQEKDLQGHKSRRMLSWK